MSLCRRMRLLLEPIKPTSERHDRDQTPLADLDAGNLAAAKQFVQLGPAKPSQSAGFWNIYRKWFELVAVLHVSISCRWTLHVSQ